MGINAASQLQGLWFNSEHGLLCGVLYVFTVSAWVFSGFSGFFPHPKHGNRCTGYSKLSLDLNECVCIGLRNQLVSNSGYIPALCQEILG